MTRPYPPPEPFPEGHGFSHPQSAICVCGVLIYECEDMLRWGLRRAEQVRGKASS